MAIIYRLLSEGSISFVICTHYMLRLICKFTSTLLDDECIRKLIIIQVFFMSICSYKLTFKSPSRFALVYLPVPISLATRLIHNVLVPVSRTYSSSYVLRSFYELDSQTHSIPRFSLDCFWFLVSPIAQQTSSLEARIITLNLIGLLVASLSLIAVQILIHMHIAT